MPRCLHTSMTRLILLWISTEAFLYARAVASPMRGSNASRKSVFERARDCWTTSLARYTRFSLLEVLLSWSRFSHRAAVRSACRLSFGQSKRMCIATL